MSAFKWHFAKLPNPDPARYDPAPYHPGVEAGGMTAGELEALRQKNASRAKKKVASKLPQMPRKSFGEVLMGRPANAIVSLSKRISIIRASGGADADAFIHETALLVLGHAKKHGDCNAALDLALAMPKGRRQLKLIAWLATYAPIEVAAHRGAVRMIPKQSSSYKAFDLDAARLKPFYCLDQ